MSPGRFFGNGDYVSGFRSEQIRVMKITNCECLGVVVAFAVLTQSQCSPSAGAIPQSAGAIASSTRNWVKVSSQPPTYYPRGVSAEAPTDHSSGEWVYTDDSYGSRYFIPIRGLGGMDRKKLLAEAFSARSQQKLNQIARDDMQILARDVRNMTVFGPPLLFGMMGGAVGGSSADKPLPNMYIVNTEANGD